MTGLYSPTVREHFRSPRNRGALDRADKSHEGANPQCGVRVRMELRFADGRVAAAGFRGDACAVTIAAASILTERVRGLTLDEAMAIADDAMVASLEAEIPPARRACALLPLTVLRAGGAEFRARSPR
jgi:nitrogen fixation protein NifU and related proteins